MTERRNTAGITALLLASTIWGTSFVLGKVALAELEVMHVLIYRFGFAVLPFLPVLLTGRVRPQRRDLRLIVLTGFLMVPVTFLLQFGGLRYTSATSAALLIGTGAPLLALAAVLFEGERLGRRGWTAVGLSCVGVVLLVGMPGAGDDWRGNLLVFLSMVLSAVWVILTKRLVGRYPTLYATGWILIAGTLTLLPISLAWAGPPPLDLSTGAWASLVALGVGCTTLAYVLWNWGVARVGAGRAGVYLNLQPITGALLGVAVMGDPLGGGVIIGGLAIVAAAWTVSAPSAASPAEPIGASPGLEWWLCGRPSVRAELALRLWAGDAAWPARVRLATNAGEKAGLAPRDDDRSVGRQADERRSTAVGGAQGEPLDPRRRAEAEVQAVVACRKERAAHHQVPLERARSGRDRRAEGSGSVDDQPRARPCGAVAQ